MRVVIVDREPVFLTTLIQDLEREGFTVKVVENISGVLSFIKSNSLHFLVADSNLLVDHSLGSEVHRQSPLTRLIVLASRPSLLGMIEAISCGITDYLARHPDSFGQLVDTILDERDRLTRWQYAILGETFNRATKPDSDDKSGSTTSFDAASSDPSEDTSA
jgi:ActR/RegA family two-component response regulator